MKIQRVIFFSNGNTGAFDSSGKQIPKLQSSWFKVFIKHLRELGCTDEELEAITFLLPENKEARYSAKDNNWTITF